MLNIGTTAIRSLFSGSLRMARVMRGRDRVWTQDSWLTVATPRDSLDRVGVWTGASTIIESVAADGTRTDITFVSVTPRDNMSLGFGTGLRTVLLPMSLFFSPTDVHITLRDSQAAGVFPSLTSFVRLVTLDLGGTALPGPLNGLNTALSRLATFDCTGCGVTGVITGATMASLRHFRVSGNGLTGTLPTMAANIIEVDVSNNQLTGGINGISARNALQIFRCYNNNMGGPINGVQLRGALRVFYISDNAFTGTFPSLATAVNLQELRCVRNNTLSGTFPSLDGLRALHTCNVHTNQFSGSIPSFSTNVALEVCGFQNNLFTGNIPDLSQCPVLRIARFSNNQLSGYAGTAVPRSLGELYAETNQLTQAAVDTLLQAFVTAGRTSGDGICILDLGGSGNANPSGFINASPSAGGLANVAVLRSRGWTVNHT